MTSRAASLATLIAAMPAVLAGPTQQLGVWPLEPRPAIVARFAPPATTYGPGHRGVDLRGGLGQRVGSALPGVVSFAGRIAGRGVVVVQHGATRTTYEPVAATVPVGTAVSAGQPVGTLELFGSHCFPRACLHWGWLRGDVYLDPLGLLGMLTVRLLPLEGPADSGARMGLLVGTTQTVGRDMGVELSRGQGRVTQQFLHGPQVRPAF